MDEINKSFSVPFQEYYNDSYYDEENFTANLSHAVCKVTGIAPEVNVFMCVFYVLIFLLAIPGNALVVLVIVSARQALTPSDMYLFNLSLADGLLALTLPLWATSMTRGWVFGDVMCKLTNMAQELSFYCSIFFLACISVDRYRVIVHAMEARKEHWVMLSRLVCAGVWSAGAILSISSAANAGTFESPDTKLQVCAEGFQQMARLLRHTVGFLLPLAIMLSCYSVTVVRLLQTRSFRKQRAMRVILAVVAAFLLCWAPHHVTVMVDTLMHIGQMQFSCSARQSMDTALFVTQSMALLHSCINPVLYAFVGEKFRRNLQQLFHRWGTLERTSSLRFSRSTSQTSEAAAFM
ncbi:C-X-C chemokine receptor type 1 [Paramormyrops kingsleyae]|uniref:C-X-C chemokine receptor type 1-like n=1 Tax=Paramormyrops kingsleyae TaxID=1676925 RepID=A0A3B3Q3R6_9TELE|nr:C-X-C chemokine receptor type 1-like [Paramormyrops kingsleyae]